MVISPLVSVPVLSEHMTVTAPQPSAAESFLIMAFLLANSLAPNARLMVTIAGKPSGTADIAREIDDMNA